MDEEATMVDTSQTVDSMDVIQNLLTINSELTMEIARLRAVVAKLVNPNPKPQPNRAERRAKPPTKKK